MCCRLQAALALRLAQICISHSKDEHAVDKVLGVQEFLEAYKGVEFTKTPEKYFKYSVKDIQDMLMNVFTQ